MIAAVVVGSNSVSTNGLAVVCIVTISVEWLKNHNNVQHRFFFSHTDE